MTKKRLWPAPSHLRPETRKWWSQICGEFVLESHHRRLLQLCAESWDAAQSAREAIQQHGQTYVDRFGAPRLRPEVNVARDATLAFARLLRELDLDIEPPSDIGTRPPGLVSNRRLSR